MTYEFDRFLRFDELTAWLHELATAHPDLLAVESYGRSHEGRELWLVTVTDSATGPPDHKPAHWVDASIHAGELTGTVAACYLLNHLVTGHTDGDPTVREALATRTFYVVPRVNPDGAEWALADPPRFRRSSTRPWPWPDGHRWPGAHAEDVDGDGRVLQMRIEDPDGSWMPHPEDARLLIPIPPSGPPPGTTRYRVLDEATVVDHDGFTVPTPRPPEGLDLNRNFPAGWSVGRHWRRRPSAVRARDRCPRAGHLGPPQRLRVQRVPHRRRRAVAAVVDPARFRPASARPVGVEAAR